MDSGPHLTEDQLEAYAMNHVRGADLEILEEHLLVCVSCQERLAETEAFVRAMREAAARTRSASEERARAPRIPKPAWAMAAVLATIAVAVVVLPRQDREAPVPVRLEALRRTTYASAPAGKPLALELDISGLPPSAQYSVEVVDGAGRAIRRSAAVPRGAGLSAPPALRLPAGRYFVRLYGGSSELLREYGLEAGPPEPVR